MSQYKSLFRTTTNCFDETAPSPTLIEEDDIVIHTDSAARTNGVLEVLEASSLSCGGTLHAATRTSASTHPQ